MVTSKERNSSKTGAIALLFSAAVMLFVLLFGGVAAADQAADTTNAGVGGANTGANGGLGNASTNGATSDQTATATGTGDDAVAPSNGSTGNSSQGNANIKTGDANATGNSATNNIQQTVVEGHNGAIVLVDQGATVTNIGIGIANTGGNIAIGNASTNDASAVQVADASGTDGDAVAANTAQVRNNSGGDARIDTGDASAVGSTSTNTVNQTFDGDFDGLGVIVLVDQGANVTNVGIGVSNTGLNAAIGNASTNTASNDQTSTANSAGTGDSVASNNATASNNSGGSAGIITGDATSVGNVATNNVSQIVNVNATGTLGSIVLTDQAADVANIGIGISNTGLNLAVGNLSTSTANNIQGAVSGAGPPAGDTVASNDGIASNESNGTASINTGDASSVGNRSTTNLTQVVDVNTDGSAIVLTDQAATVINLGIALSNTGGNAALGNASLLNAASNDQTATNNITGDADDAVAANFGSATTNSNGSADINTGNADALGNASTTNLAQTTDANTDGGFVLSDQVATVANIGIGIANSGLNIAAGNVSTNSAANTQEATVDVTGSSDDAVASNFGDAASNSDGSADITTGWANSVGNNSAATTNVAQTVDTNGANNVLTDQEVTAIDLGIGFSNTGLNAAIGNASTNDAAQTQTTTLTVAGDADDVVASNFGDSATNSDGSASINTGNATSLGSAGHTNIAQTVDSDADGFTLSDQAATNVNIGAGIANTGLNLAVGNVSTNTSNTNTQDSTVTVGGDVLGDAVSANFGSSSAASNGSADINTGHAAAAGQRSTVNIAQTVDANGDGFVMPDQTVAAVNIGIGLANTGANIGIGNASTTNDSALAQNALVDVTGDIDGDAVASNDGTSSVASDGSADITTGNANGVGNDNEHTLTISQTADANGSGFLLGDQDVTAVNVGLGVANTGVNVAIGNASTNTSALTQGGGGIAVGGDLNGDAVASNNGTSNTSSDGSATIKTGFADSFGNASTTTIAQTTDFNGDGFVLTDQVAVSANIGIGVSNTGANFAFGNLSSNDNTVDQTTGVAVTGDIFGDVVAANTANTNTDSDGSADITTGVARSVGNRSTTALAQTNDATIDGNGFVLSDQNAAQVDLGVGIANTGLNFAFGNGSQTNDVALTQDASVTATNIGTVDAPVDVVSSNSANSNINSDGSASINTGAAESTGNWTRNSLYQVNDANINGGGFVLSDQIAVVANIGIGVSNTGANFAFGNLSTNTTAPTQTALVDAAGDLNADDVVASNAANTNSNSDGSADITTGDARTIGNDGAHTTAISQLADSNVDGAGFILSDQDATDVNLGVGIANSGINIGIGNASTNTVDGLTQTATVQSAGDIVADDVVSANTLNATTDSNGSASINTGDAEGVGNRSTTTISQVADNDIADGSFVDNDQTGVVVNLGLGLGNSGLNLALGNGSTNTVGPVTQDSLVDGAGAGGIIADDVVAANTAAIQNNSDGSADVTTGNAGGYGNISTTTLDGGDFTVLNLGLGLGNSGLNAAIGNVSTNTATVADTATVSGDPFEADDVVASNTVATGNNSNGSASVDTGDAVGYGNTSTTTAQSDGGDVIVLNLGLGLSNSGLNAGIGNASTNTIDTTDDATVNPAVAVVDDAVANNALTETNVSDGDVDITTGDAYALGNRSATGIVEAETATTINLGVGLANTGLNLGAGNLSTNTITNTTTATAPAGGVASNVADLSNDSDGSVDITTGNANAFGNIASNATCQGVGFGGNCPQPTLPPLPNGFPEIPSGNNGGNNGGNNNNGKPVTPVTPVQQPLARTGVAAGTQVLLGLLLLAIGALLRRKARTA